MKIQEIIEIVKAEALIINQEVDIKSAFASDLMSDALRMIQDEPEHMLLITGLCNAQSMRTADMLDIKTILFVRGKQLQEEDLELAKSLGMNILTTEMTMYEASGQLYMKGLRPNL